MTEKRAHVFLEGRVQGVYFRSYTREWAEGARVVGWVRNAPDGRLEVVLEGEEEDILEVVGYMKQGPPYAQVNKVNFDWEEPTGEFKEFSVRHR